MSEDTDDAPLSDLADELREGDDRRDRSADDDAADGSRDGRSGGRSRGGDRASDAAPPGDDRPSSFDEPGPESLGDAAPLSDLAAEVGRRRDADDLENAFEEMDVPDVDAERLWEQLVEGGDDAVVFSERVDGERDRDVRVVPKRTCQNCPYFADPPDVACTHDGTDILELVDVDHHKVADCPMVVDDDALDAGFDAEL